MGDCNSSEQNELAKFEGIHHSHQVLCLGSKDSFAIDLETIQGFWNSNLWGFEYPFKGVAKSSEMACSSGGGGKSHMPPAL